MRGLGLVTFGSESEEEEGADESISEPDVNVGSVEIVPLDP